MRKVFRVHFLSLCLTNVSKSHCISEIFGVMSPLFFSFFALLVSLILGFSSSFLTLASTPTEFTIPCISVTPGLGSR